MLGSPTWSRAPAMSSVLICCGVGRALKVCFHCCATSAAMPVTTGDDIEVPLMLAYPPFGTVENWSRPMAMRSGLTRPSLAGPRELKDAISPAEPQAPTASTFFSAGMKLIVLNAVYVGCLTVSQCEATEPSSSVDFVLLPAVHVGTGQSLPLPFCE